MLKFFIYFIPKKVDMSLKFISIDSDGHSLYCFFSP